MARQALVTRHLAVMAALDASECVAALMQRRYCSVLRTADATAVASLADAYIAGGIEVVEFTMTCPHRFEHIKDYARRGDCLVGLGTCLTVDDAARGIAAGASFVVSPVFGEEVVRECVRQNKVVIPGCASRALAPLPLIFANRSEKSLCGTGAIPQPRCTTLTCLGLSSRSSFPHPKEGPRGCGRHSARFRCCRSFPRLASLVSCCSAVCTTS